ncbi:MAG: hypothetical protein U5L09_00440 [Bacteroidales bacterium]|nr:hypothetical protein [Bacteroidales bacterium]
MSIKENLHKLYQEIPKNVQLVAVSKTKPAGDILEAYHAGHRVFGREQGTGTDSQQWQLP